MSTFGRILSFGVVEQYFLDLADRWFEEYLAEVERQLDEPPRTFPNIRDSGFATNFELWPEEHLPFLLVMNTGLADRPVKRGDGTWDARPLMAAAIIVSTPTKRDTRWAAHAYGAAFKAMVLQHRSLEHPDDIGGVTWVDERPASIANDAERTIGGMNMYFYVDVKNVMTERGTPPESEPRDDPYLAPGDYPVIGEDDTYVTIAQREIE